MYYTNLFIHSFFLSVLTLYPSVSSHIAPGLIYQHIQYNEPGPLSIHMLQIDPTCNNIALEHALGYGTDREEVSSIAKRTGALAAVNGSNYRRGGRYNGNSVNLSIINNTLITDPNINRGAIGWDDEGNVLIDCVHVAWRLRIGDKEYPISRVNQPRADYEAILYTTSFRPSTLTNKQGTEIIIAENHVIAITDRGNATIPTNGFVYSVGSDFAIDISGIAPGMSVEIDYHLIPESDNDITWNNFHTILGGAGILIQNGIINEELNGELQKGTRIVHSHDEITADFHIDEERNWLINLPHPRTAIGIMPNGTWLLLVIDGRQPGLSEGITLPELAMLMQKFGCIQAINIGGGGCTTMYANGCIINSPSGPERPVSEAVIITPLALPYQSESGCINNRFVL